VLTTNLFTDHRSRLINLNNKHTSGINFNLVNGRRKAHSSAIYIRPKQKARAKAVLRLLLQFANLNFPINIAPDVKGIFQEYYQFYPD
jgi:hypothetical protein